MVLSIHKKPLLMMGQHISPPSYICNLMVDIGIPGPPHDTSVFLMVWAQEPQ